MHWFVLITALMSVKAQDLTSIHAKHPKQFQSYNPYYSPGYYPNTKFKPGSTYKAIPPLYNPSDICFNPNYYGFLNTGEGISQTSPVPQPNIYYMPNANIQPSSAHPATAWPSYQYTPWTWNSYPYIGSPAQQFTSPSTNQLGLSLPHSPTTTSATHQRSSTEQQDETTSTPPESIKIIRPTMSVKIVPPAFNKNATSITNMASPLSWSDPKDQNIKLSETNRKMIKKLLEMGDMFLKSKSNRRSSKGTDEVIGMNPLAPDNEMVILPNGQSSQSNEYPLPKDVFGNKNEPSSSFERMKILTEFNPPA